MNSDKSMKSGSDREEALQSLYKTAIRASYFGGMQDPHFLRKTNMQIKQMAEKPESEID